MWAVLLTAGAADADPSFLMVRRWCVVVATAALAALAFAGPAAAAARTGAAAPAVSAEGGPAYWLFGGDGGVFPFGRAAYAGSLAATATNAPIVGGAATVTGDGYWLVAADGGVFAYGDARWYGSRPAPAAIVGITPTPDGKGYWLAGLTGGVFSYGDARFFGSAPVPGAIAAIASTPDGRGYWLVATTGAVYSFGDAAYAGGLTGHLLQAPVVAIVPTADGGGYWLAGADGGVYAFGDATYLGGLSGRPHGRVVGMARTPTGSGYWLVAADGGVFGFGNAGYYGGVGASRLNRGIVGIASSNGTATPVAPTAPVSTAGFDISWPQCGRVRPAPPYGFGIVGVTGGHPFSVNPCLTQQWDWARTYGSFASVYVNTDAPTAAEWAAFSAGPAAACGSNAGCLLDLWGRRAVDQAVSAAASVAAPMWWLDVETSNVWLPDTAANAVVLRAMVDELRKDGKFVGVYSTSSQWSRIAGSYTPNLPVWVPGAPAGEAAAWCEGHSFGGGPTWLTQSGDGTFDTDVLCAAGLIQYQTAFAQPAPLAVPHYGAPVGLNDGAAPQPAAPAPSRRVPRQRRAGPVHHRSHRLLWPAVVWSVVAVVLPGWARREEPANP